MRAKAYITWLILLKKKEYKIQNTNTKLGTKNEYLLRIRKGFMQITLELWNFGRPDLFLVTLLWAIYRNVYIEVQSDFPPPLRTFYQPQKLPTFTEVQARDPKA